MSTSPIIRIHPITRPKINALRQQFPTWSIQSIIDDAIEALATQQGLNLKLPKRKPSKSAA